MTVLRLGAIGCALLALAGCAKASSNPATTLDFAVTHTTASLPRAWSAADVSALERSLSATFGASALAESGIAIVDAAARPLYVQRASAAFAPASTFKLLAAVTALETLGPNYRFQTTFEALGPPQDGTLAGDLYLVGSGDPSLTSDDLRAGVGELVRAGVQHVSGGIVADASAFAGREINPAWDPDDLQYDYAAGTSALSLDEGTVELHVVPTAVGEPARIEVRPPSDDVRIVGTATTGGDTTLELDRAPTSNTFTFSGGIAQDAEQSFWRPVIDLPMYAASVARTMLVQRGIAVDGGTRVGVAPVVATVLWRHESAPLAALLSHMLFESDNHYAEQLLRAAGAAQSDVGTVRSGEAIERLVLSRMGVPVDGLHVVDGSGLAPTDRVAPISLATLLARAALGPDGPVLVRSLPLVGLEGTVRHHDLTVALGRARAKSGHIEDVDALAGYVDTRRHGRVAFAIVVNGPQADDGPVVDGMDRALDLLAAQ